MSDNIHYWCGFEPAAEFRCGGLIIAVAATDDGIRSVVEMVAEPYTRYECTVGVPAFRSSDSDESLRSAAHAAISYATSRETNSDRDAATEIEDAAVYGDDGWAIELAE